MNEPSLNRREIAGALAAALALTATPGIAAPARRRRILLRSGWQTENIGDVAHTPGILALIERYIPDADVVFWPWYDYLFEYEITMLKRRFPSLTIVRGKLDDKGKASTPELAKAVAEVDFFLHGSGPYALAWMDALAFHSSTGKPFGVYGVTYGHWIFGNAEKDALSKASFAFFRDRVSLRKATDDGVRAKIMDFSPDAVFAIDVADDQAGRAFIQKYGLTQGKFLCCIPKHRYTPTWLHVRKNRPIDNRLHSRNQEMRELDHVPLREAITLVTRQTDMKVLICNEDETETPIGKEWLLDRLPEDVKRKTVWLERPWEMAEAIGVYRLSAGLFGHEMHSPIMCIANGIPAFVGRWVEQSSKGTMWADIGLGDWLFNMDSAADVERLPAAVLNLAKNPVAARNKAEVARAFARNRLAETMQIVKQASRPA